MKPCRKKPFNYESDAKQFNSGQTPYQCRDCKQWHLTSNGAGKIFRASGHPAEAFEWVRRHVRTRKQKRVKYIPEDEE